MTIGKHSRMERVSGYTGRKAAALGLAGSCRRDLAAGIALVALISAQPAVAYSVTITSGSRAIYLQVGEGAYATPYANGGSPGNNGTINVVSVSVPAASIGTGTAQSMTSNSSVSLSPIDGFAFCNLPAEVYIGAWVRSGSGSTSVATLTVTSPASLTSSGDSIPFSQIGWVMSGSGDTVYEFPNGNFNGATQTLGSIPANTWKEQCMTFSYANAAIPAAGAYTGRVTYTLSLP